MSKQQIKSALESLQVKKPLRLPSRTPAFQAPKPPTPVPAPAASTPPLEPITPSGVVKSSEAAPVENAAPVGNRAGVQKSAHPQERRRASKRADHQRSRPESKSPEPTKDVQADATEQTSSVRFEQRTADGLERGYTRVPNALLMRLIGTEFTRNEIKLALLVARFTISFQRTHAPLSKTVLARRLGLKESSVLEALAGLVRKGVVEKRQGDAHRPNLLGLILPNNWEGKPAPAENPAEGKKPDEAGAPYPGPAPARKPAPFKDTSKIPERTSPSPLPEKLRAYVESLKPARKRESELQALLELREDYPDADIADCLDLVLKRGVQAGESTQPCHSPMAYLAVAMQEVLTEIEANREKIQSRKARERRQAEEERKRQEESDREEREFRQREQAFAHAFPTEDRQAEVVTEVCREAPFAPKGALARVFAINRWWEGQQAMPTCDENGEASESAPTRGSHD